MRADARGLSGTLIASIPTDFRYRAPSISFPASFPSGGTISTKVTNSPAAIFLPTLERCPKGSAERGFSAGAAALARAGVVFASPARREDFIARRWSGVAPQHP